MSFKTHQFDGGLLRSTAAGSVENCLGFELENNSLDELSNKIKLFDFTSSPESYLLLFCSAIVKSLLVNPFQSISPLKSPYFEEYQLNRCFVYFLMNFLECSLS
jgi:hypothetical protein